MNDHCPRLSVVLPVLNESRDIGRLLEELCGQVAPPGGFEVVVADGGSTDGTREIVTGYVQSQTHVRLVDNPRRLSSAGRNAGARAAAGTYVLYLDGHCTVPRQDYLARVVQLFDETGAECLSRPQPLNVLADGRWSRAIATARHSWLGHNRSSNIYGGEPGYTDPRSAGAAYVREWILRLGGYDERFDACEDVEFNHRVATAGLRAYLHPDLQINYRPRSDLRGLLRQMFRYGRGRARLLARHSEVRPWPLICGSALAAAIILLTLLGQIRLGLGLAVFAACTAGLLIGIESIRLGGLRMEAARIAAAFVTIFLGLVLGFWRGLLEYRRYRQEVS